MKNYVTFVRGSTYLPWNQGHGHAEAFEVSTLADTTLWMEVQLNHQPITVIQEGMAVADDLDIY